MCALRLDGRIACWDDNYAKRVLRNEPVESDIRAGVSHAIREIAGITDAVSVAGGKNHACAVRRGGSVV